MATCWQVSRGNVWSCPVSTTGFGVRGRQISKMLEKAARMVGMWTRLQNKVGSEDPASLLDKLYLGCTQRAARTNQRIVEKNRTSFESVVSAGIMRFLARSKLQRTLRLRPTTWNLMRKSVSNIIEGEQRRKSSNYRKSLTPCV